MNYKLKVALHKEGLTQHAAARAIGVTETRLSRIVTGRISPTPEEKKALARLLKMPAQLLFQDPGRERPAEL